ncbi:MAG TPA: glycosyltransferase family 39 protein [Syntrophorhabdaceae bacterium]|nr:glycosyltransferase family 39 protein [Syntrophorhabdaceae bacterium]
MIKERFKNPFIVSIFLFLFALMLRVYVAFTAGVITPDGVNYIEAAKMIIDGDLRKIVDISFINLYPFLIVAFQKIFINWETAGRLVSVVFGSIAVIPFFLLVRGLINERVAFVAALFYCISTRLVDYSSDVLREPVFWCFSIAALYFAWKGITRGNTIFVALASIFMGLSMFTRFEGASFVLIIILWMIWYWMDGAISLKRLLFMAFVFAISLPLVALPFLINLKNSVGKWEFGLVGSKLPQFFVVSDAKDDLELKQEVLNQTTTRFRAFYDMASRQKHSVYLSEAVYKFAKSSHLVFFILFLFGVIKRKYIPHSRGEIPFLIWFTIFFLSIYVYMVKTSYLSTRHGLLLGIPALVWVSIGFFELKGRIGHLLSKGSEKLANMSRYANAVLLLIIFIIVLPNALTPSGKDKIELKKAGYYLKKLGYSGAKIIGEPSLSRVGFYADAKFIAIYPGFDLAQYLDHSKENGNYYVMLDDRTINTYMPGFRESLDPAKFEKVSLPQLESFKEYAISVYRIKNE